jgi:SnoaL-like domain
VSPEAELPTEGGAGLAAMVQRLVDDAAASRIMIEYARGIDRRDWDLVRSCFAEGAVVHGTAFGGALDDYLAVLRPGVERFGSTQHFVGNQRREIDGDHGFTETYLIARHFVDPQGEVESLTVGVRYEDQIVRRGSGWAIARRDVFQMWRRVGEDIAP